MIHYGSKKSGIIVASDPSSGEENCDMNINENHNRKKTKEREREWEKIISQCSNRRKNGESERE